MSRTKLGTRIRQYKDGHQTSLSDLTVLLSQNNPYRLDTPAGHRDAEWFAEQFARAKRDTIHRRGLHYAIVAAGDVLKPNSSPYRNTDADWTWLQISASKAARWLDYIGFDRITAARNDPPVIHRLSKVSPRTGIYPGDISISIPEAADIRPQVYAHVQGRQPYHLALFGEKSSLADVVLPIAGRYNADLFLPSGEISDTLFYRMAGDGADDGRPMRVFTLSDCDPAGHQMPVSIGRKLQALRDLEFPDLDFEVRPVALTVDQVKELNLPSTPLKDTQRRAGRWRAAFGIEQTEIDALATLRPDVLWDIVEDALVPFYDRTLDRRARDAETVWEIEAQRRLDERLDPGLLEDLHAEAEKRLDDIRAHVDPLKNELRIPVPDVLDLPEIIVPQPVIDREFARQAIGFFCLALARDDRRAPGAQALWERRMSALTPVLPKVTPLVGELASAHDGEVVAVVRHLRRVLADQELGFKDLALALEPQPESARSHDPAWPPKSWHALYRRLVAANGGPLRPREREFTDSMMGWRGRPTDRQQQWLHSMYVRLGGGR